jgi:hypothetical protein
MQIKPTRDRFGMKHVQIILKISVTVSDTILVTEEKICTTF